jgi:ferritin-like metal-binding protein YciE
MHLNSLEDVLHEELEDLHSAERQLVVALPEIAGAATSEELRDAILEHMDETREHVRRLDTIFQQLGLSAPVGHCEAMEGLIREGQEIVAAGGDPLARDAALIGAAQRVEHYEIAAYGTARTLADELGHDETAMILDSTLREESQADKKLTKIATGGMFRSGLNTAAAGRS